MAHPVVREETCEMERNTFQTVLHHPPTHAPKAVHIVVYIGNQQVRQLHPNARIAHGKNRIKHNLQAPTAHLAVRIVVEVLQVHIGSIDERQQVVQRFAAYIACRDKNIPQTFLMCQPRRIHYIFYVGERFGVRVRNARTTARQTEADHLPGRQLGVPDIVGSSLRNVVVLAVKAVQIAPRAGDGQTSRSGMEVVQWFLLYRIDGQSARTAIDLAHQ